MDGSREPSQIKDIVHKVIANLSGEGLPQKQQRLTEEEIRGFWRKAAGKIASQRSRPTSLKKGKLVVTVADSSLLYDLTLRKREILESLTKDLKDRIEDMQFRIGDISGEGKTKDKTRKRENPKGR